jgi:ABC-type phosphate transport system substrate-binding protein
MKLVIPAFIRAAAAVGGLAFGLSAASATADAVAVVSTKNPVIALTKDQIADIFLGKSAHFPDGRPAVPIDQVEGSAAREEFYLKFAGRAPAQVKAYWSKLIFTGRGQPPREASSGTEVKKLLVANPDAISYIERNAVDASVKVVSLP